MDHRHEHVRARSHRSVPRRLHRRRYLVAPLTSTASTHVSRGGLAYTLAGDTAAEPVVLVHGSWVDGSTWRALLPHLARRFRVLAYDRRGHGASAPHPGQGSVYEDVADLAALIEENGLAPAHVVGNSFGGSIALRLAGERPELVRTLAIHEPPLPKLLAQQVPAFIPVVHGMEARIAVCTRRLAAGDLEGGARQFIDATEFTGAWDRLPADVRTMWIANALSFLDEERDPETRTLDIDRLTRYTGPALLTRGERGAAFFADVLEVLAAALPHAQVRSIPGMGHAPHLAAPERYAAMLQRFMTGAEALPSA